MRRLALAIILTSTAVLAADILHLRDGSRHYGELIRRNDREVLFRVVQPGGAALVRTFDARLVVRVETGAEPAPAAPSSRPAADGDRADADDAPFMAVAGPGVMTRAERVQQLLWEGFALADDYDWAAALRAVQRAVLEAGSADLRALELLCDRERGRPLPEFLADLRLRAAGAEAGRGAFRLRWATEYERPALAARLRALEAELLDSRSDGRTLREWASNSAAYTDIRPESRKLVFEAARAAAVLDARLRLDPGLTDRGERLSRTQLHDRLAALASRVMGLPGYSAAALDDAGDPAAQVARRLAQEAAVASQPAVQPELAAGGTHEEQP